MRIHGEEMGAKLLHLHSRKGVRLLAERLATCLHRYQWQWKLLFTTQFDRSLSIHSLIKLHKHTHDDAFQITH